jgi:hypothetical protein
VATLGAAGTAAGATWTKQTVPPPQAANGGLQGVSCSAVNACTAVGVFMDSTGVGRTEAERWNGASWTVQFTPYKSGATETFLNSVSCGGATSCTAVGFWDGAQDPSGPYIAHWNGTGWTPQSAPGGSGGGEISLQSVSCSSASTCTAVGHVNNSGQLSATAMRWTGGAWSPQSVPVPSGATYSVLSSVACSTAASCVAVGTFTMSGLDKPLVETWNGTTWHAQTLTAPSGASNPELTAVSCTAATACSAVGNDSLNDDRDTFAERLSGTTWTLESMPPAPSYYNGYVLNGISCSAANACEAVGESTGSPDTSVLMERWNGSTWALHSAPSPSGPIARLWGVACPATGSCVSVGGTDVPTLNPYPPTTGYFSGYGRAFAETWNGHTWSLPAVPNHAGAEDSGLQAVDCRGNGFCMAVGDADVTWQNMHTSVGEPLAEGWDGTAWTIQRVPLPARMANGELTDVSCGSTSLCIALGTGDDPQNHPDTGFAERWNGSTWSPLALPAVVWGTFNAVSCSSPTACTVVGSYRNSAGKDAPLAERYNRSSWSNQNAPIPPGETDPYFEAVSCPTATSCVASGADITSYEEDGYDSIRLIESWDGNTWKVASLPALPPNTQSSDLPSVSCSSPTACTALGYAYGNSASSNLALRWNGNRWTTQSLTGGGTEGFGSVSCATATACKAVTGDQVATWNGSTWSSELVPALGDGSTFLTPENVKCTSATSCLFVGDEAAGTEVAVPLALLWSP